MKIKVFLFHRVSPERDLLWNPIHPKLFERIVSFLHKNYEIVPLEQTLIGNYKPESKKRLCAITFDDGYKDFIEYSFPILHKYNAPCSMYVVTDCVNHDIPPWTYVLNHLFINTSHVVLDLKSKALLPNLRNTSWKNQEERIQYAKKLSPFIKQLNNHERLLIYNQIVADFDDVDKPEGMMMTWEEIKEIYSNGCEIGSHSVSHPLLAKKINSEDLTHELIDSGKIIESHIGKFPLAISYPFGSYNEQVKKTAINTGYRCGLAVNNETYDSNKHQLFSIPRIELYDEPFFKSKMRINGLMKTMSRILRK